MKTIIAICLFLIFPVNAEAEHPEDHYSKKNPPPVYKKFWEQKLATNLDASVQTSFNHWDHASVAFKGKMWILGGKLTATQWTNAVYSSTDGLTWNKVTDAPWGNRAGHTAVVFKDKIWVMGGTLQQGHVLQNDIWSSSDGVTWNKVANAPWKPRSQFASVIFKDKIWVIGGLYKGLNHYYVINDVWSSSDGITWENTHRENYAWQGVWRPRHHHTAVVFKEKMWILGGANYQRDVWSSSDGINWGRVAVSTPWGFRGNHSSVVYLNKMWVFGGRPPSWQRGQYTETKSDAWSSSDGVNWESTVKAPADAEFPRILIQGLSKTECSDKVLAEPSATTSDSATIKEKIKTCEKENGHTISIK